MSEQEKIQRAKQELNEYYDLVRKARNLKNNLDELKTRMQSIKVFVGGERVSSSVKKSNNLEVYIDKCTELEKTIVATIWDMSAKQNAIEQKINGLHGVYADILHKRYIERKRLEVISVECNYSFRYTKYMHKNALLSFYESQHLLAP